MFAAAHATCIPVTSILGRTQLWGAAAGDRVGAAVQVALHESPTKIITVDLRGISAFDPMFAEHAFLRAVNDARDSNRTLYFEVGSESTLDGLDWLFRQHRLMVPVSFRRVFRLAGDADFPERVLFERLVTASPIVVDVVSEELGGDREAIEHTIRRLQESRLAVELRPGIYRGTLPAQVLFTAARGMIKTAKLWFHIAPLHRSAIGRLFGGLLRPPRQNAFCKGANRAGWFRRHRSLKNTEDPSVKPIR